MKFVIIWMILPLAIGAVIALLALKYCLKRWHLLSHNDDSKLVELVEELLLALFVGSGDVDALQSHRSHPYSWELKHVVFRNERREVVDQQT